MNLNFNEVKKIPQMKVMGLSVGVIVAVVTAYYVGKKYG